MKKSSLKFKTLVGSSVGLLGVTSVVAPLSILVSCSKANKSSFLGSDIDKEFDVTEATVTALIRSFRDQYKVKLETDWAEKPENIKRKLDSFDRVMPSMAARCNDKSCSVVASSIVKFAREAYGINLITTSKVQLSDVTRLWDGMKSSMIAAMHNSQASPKEIDEAMNYAEEQKTLIMSDIYTKYGVTPDPLTVYIEAKGKLGACFAKVNRTIAKMSAASRLKDFFDKYTIDLKVDSDDENVSFKAPRLDDLQMNDGSLHQKFDEKGNVHYFTPYFADADGNVISDGDVSLWANDIFEFTNRLTGEKENFNSKNMIPGYHIKPILKEISHSGISNEHLIKIDWQAINTNLSAEASKASIGHLFKDGGNLQSKLSDSEGQEEAPSLDEIFDDSNIQTMDYDMPISEYGENRTSSEPVSYTINNPAPGSEAWWLKKTYFTSLEERIKDKEELNETEYQGILPDSEFDQRANIAFKWDDSSRLSYESLFIGDVEDISVLESEIFQGDEGPTIDGNKVHFLSYTRSLAEAGLLITQDEITEAENESGEDNRNFYPLIEAITGLQYEEQDADGKVIPMDIKHITPECTKINNFIANVEIVGVVDTNKIDGSDLKIRLTPVYLNSTNAQKGYKNRTEFENSIQMVDNRSEWYETTFKKGEFPLSSKAFYHINESYNDWMDLFCKYEVDGEYDSKIDDVTLVLITYCAATMLALLVTAWSFTQVTMNAIRPWIAVTYAAINLLSIVSVILLIVSVDHYTKNRFMPALHFDNRLDEVRADQRYVDMANWLGTLKEKIGTVRWNINYEIKESDYEKGYKEKYAKSDYWADIAPQVSQLTGVGGGVEDIQRNFIELLEEKDVQPAKWEELSADWQPGGCHYKKADRLDKAALIIDGSCIAVGLILPFVEWKITQSIIAAATTERNIARNLLDNEVAPNPLPVGQDAPSYNGSGILEGSDEEIITPSRRINVNNLSSAAKREIEDIENIVTKTKKTGQIPEADVEKYVSRPRVETPILNAKERRPIFDKVAQNFFNRNDDTVMRRVCVNDGTGHARTEYRIVNTEASKFRWSHGTKGQFYTKYLQNVDVYVPLFKSAQKTSARYSADFEQFLEKNTISPLIRDDINAAKQQTQHLMESYRVKYSNIAANNMAKAIRGDSKLVRYLKLKKGLAYFNKAMSTAFRRNGASNAMDQIYNTAWLQTRIEEVAFHNSSVDSLLAVKEPAYLSAKEASTHWIQREMKFVTSKNVDLRTNLSSKLENALPVQKITSKLDPKAKYTLFPSYGTSNTESIFGSWSEIGYAGQTRYRVTKYDAVSALKPQQWSFKAWARQKFKPWTDLLPNIEDRMLYFDREFTKSMIYDEATNSLRKEFVDMRNWFRKTTGPTYDNFASTMPYPVKLKIRNIEVTGPRGTTIRPYSSQNDPVFSHFIENIHTECAKDPELFDDIFQAYFEKGSWQHPKKDMMTYEAGNWARQGLDAFIKKLTEATSNEFQKRLIIVGDIRI